MSTNTDPNLDWSNNTYEDTAQIELKDNILVLSCAAKRLRLEDWNSSISDYSLPEKVIAEDRELAAKISLHYLNKIGKIVFDSLRCNEEIDKLTKFRRDLNTLLTSDYRLVANNVNTQKFSYPMTFMGMAYKLPYFYEYDIALEELIGNNIFGVVDELFPRYQQDLVLRFIKKLDPFQKNSNRVEYWFSSIKVNKVCISLEKNNPLLSLWERTINSGSLHVSGKLTPRLKDNLYYYQLDSWEIVPTQETL